jgi:hypothetical protein
LKKIRNLDGIDSRKSVDLPKGGRTIGSSIRRVNSDFCRKILACVSHAKPQAASHEQTAQPGPFGELDLAPHHDDDYTAAPRERTRAIEKGAAGSVIEKCGQHFSF